MRKTWFLSSRKKRRKRKLIAIMRYIVALKNSDHVAHFISNKVFAHLIVNIWFSIQQSNTRPETFLIIILIIKPKIWCLRLEMLECCLQHLTVPTRVQWLQFESSNIKFSSRAGSAMWILRSLALARIRESKHIKWVFRKSPLVFDCLWSCGPANICASLIVCGNLKTICSSD